MNTNAIHTGTASSRQAKEAINHAKVERLARSMPEAPLEALEMLHI